MDNYKLENSEIFKSEPNKDINIQKSSSNRMIRNIKNQKYFQNYIKITFILQDLKV